MNKVTILLITICVVLTILIVKEDKQDSTQEKELYNTKVTNCIELSSSIPRVYDFYRMKDKTDIEVSSIIRVDKSIVNQCR